MKKRALLAINCVVLIALVVPGLLTLSTTLASSTEGDGLEQSATRQDTFTHTVFAEELTGTWCGYCPQASETLNAIYESGDYPFYFVSLIEDVNDEANARCTQDYNVGGYPTVEFDGGYREEVGAPSDESEYRAAIEACGARSVPNIDLEVTAVARGGALINVTAVATNNGSTEYSGTLRVYITEIVSRYLDADGNNYPFGFLDFAMERDVTIPSAQSVTLQTDWDGAAHTDANGDDFADITMDNIMVIGSMFNSQGVLKVRPGFPPSQFTAYYADETDATGILTDSEPPTVAILSPPASSEVNGTVDIDAYVTDNEGVRRVEYRIDNDEWQSMAPTSGSHYGASWDTSAIPDGDHTLAVRAFDTAYNIGSDGITVRLNNTPEDMSPPAISDIEHVPVQPTAGQLVTVSCVVEDESEIAAVVLEYELDGDREAKTMSEGATRYSAIIGPFSAGDTVTYRVKAADIWDNQANSSWYSFNVTEVGDTEPPVIDDVAHHPSAPVVDTEVVFNCTITDNVAVKNATAKIHYFRSDGPTEQRTVELEPVGAGEDFSGTSEPFEVTGQVEYTIYAEDLAGNPSETEQYSFNVRPSGADTEPPTIGTPSYTPASPTSEDTITISAVVTDNEAVASVEFKYHICSGGSCGMPQTATMTLVSGSEYRCEIGPFNALEEIEGEVVAEDTSGNVERSEQLTIVITTGEEDTTAPEISDISYTPASPTTEEEVVITAYVTDDTAVDGVILHWRRGTASFETKVMAEEGAGRYAARIGPFSSATTVQFYIVAADRAGNEAESTQREFEVETETASDTTRPIISSVSTTPTAPKAGESVTVTARVTDDIEVSMVQFSFYSDRWQTRSMTKSDMDLYSTSLVFDQPGTYACLVLAQDTAGNERETQFSITVEAVEDDPDTNGDSDGDGSESSPGFGTGGALIAFGAVCVLLLIGRHRRRRRN